ncbi:hypothetical protein U1Q18_051666 [Sarracenia purpurea var. burkii]
MRRLTEVIPRPTNEFEHGEEKNLGDEDDAILISKKYVRWVKREGCARNTMPENFIYFNKLAMIFQHRNDEKFRSKRSGLLSRNEKKKDTKDGDRVREEKTETRYFTSTERCGVGIGEGGELSV